MIFPVLLFGIAALGGVALASFRLRGQDFPMPLSIVHGLVAAAGLVALLLEVLGGGASGIIQWSLGLFVVAALGGFVAFSFHLRKQELPIPLMVVHALVAVVAYLLLLKGVYMP